MKKILWLILAAVAAVGAVYYFILRKPAASAAPVAQTTGTQTGFAAFFPGWTGFNQASLAAAGNNVKSYTSLLTTVSNAFGFNDGGTNPGVSTNGSANGGAASSGSGVGLPTPSNSTANDVFSSVLNPPASQLYDTTTGLNGTGNFDVSSLSLGA